MRRWQAICSKPVAYRQKMHNHLLLRLRLVLSPSILNRIDLEQPKVSKEHNWLGHA